MNFFAQQTKLLRTSLERLRSTRSDLYDSIGLCRAVYNERLLRTQTYTFVFVEDIYWFCSYSLWTASFFVSSAVCIRSIHVSQCNRKHINMKRLRNVAALINCCRLSRLFDCCSMLFKQHCCLNGKIALSGYRMAVTMIMNSLRNAHSYQLNFDCSGNCIKPKQKCKKLLCCLSAIWMQTWHQRSYDHTL